MPNIKSAKKRTKVIQTKTLRNQIIKSSTKTAIRRFNEALDAGDKAKVEETFKLAVKKLDQAASKGIYHKKTVARKKSQLAIAAKI